MLELHKDLLAAVNLVDKTLEDSRVKIVVKLLLFVRLLQVATMLIPIQILIIVNSDSLGRIGRLIPSAKDFSQQTIIYVLIGVLCAVLVGSILANFHVIKTQSRINAGLAKRKVTVTSGQMKSLIKVKSEGALIVTIILIMFFLCPELSALASIIFLGSMWITERLYTRGPNYLDMLFKTSPVISFIIIFVALIFATYIGRLTLIQAIVSFLLLRLFSQSIARFGRNVLKFSPLA